MKIVVFVLAATVCLSSAAPREGRQFGRIAAWLFGTSEDTEPVQETPSYHPRQLTQDERRRANTQRTPVERRLSLGKVPERLQQQQPVVVAPYTRARGVGPRGNNQYHGENQILEKRKLLMPIISSSYSSTNIQGLNGRNKEKEIFPPTPTSAEDLDEAEATKTVNTNNIEAKKEVEKEEEEDKGVEVKAIIEEIFQGEKTKTVKTAEYPIQTDDGLEAETSPYLPDLPPAMDLHNQIAEVETRRPDQKYQLVVKEGPTTNPAGYDTPIVPKRPDTAPPSRSKPIRFPAEDTSSKQQQQQQQQPLTQDRNSEVGRPNGEVGGDAFLPGRDILNKPQVPILQQERKPFVPPRLPVPPYPGKLSNIKPNRKPQLQQPQQLQEQPLDSTESDTEQGSFFDFLPFIGKSSSSSKPSGPPKKKKPYPPGFPPKKYPGRPPLPPAPPAPTVTKIDQAPPPNYPEGLQAPALFKVGGSIDAYPPPRPPTGPYKFAKPLTTAQLPQQQQQQQQQQRPVETTTGTTTEAVDTETNQVEDRVDTVEDQLLVDTEPQPFIVTGEVEPLSTSPPPPPPRPLNLPPGHRHHPHQYPRPNRIDSVGEVVPANPPTKFKQRPPPPPPPGSQGYRPRPLKRRPSLPPPPPVPQPQSVGDDSDVRGGAAAAPLQMTSQPVIGLPQAPPSIKQTPFIPKRPPMPPQFPVSFNQPPPLQFSGGAPPPRRPAKQPAENSGVVGDEPEADSTPFLSSLLSSFFSTTTISPVPAPSLPTIVEDTEFPAQPFRGNPRPDTRRKRLPPLLLKDKISPRNNDPPSDITSSSASTATTTTISPADAEELDATTTIIELTDTVPEGEVVPSLDTMSAPGSSSSSSSHRSSTTSYSQPPTTRPPIVRSSPPTTSTTVTTTESPTVASSFATTTTTTTTAAKSVLAEVVDELTSEGLRDASSEMSGSELAAIRKNFQDKKNIFEQFVPMADSISEGNSIASISSTNYWSNNANRRNAAIQSVSPPNLARKRAGGSSNSNSPSTEQSEPIGAADYDEQMTTTIPGTSLLLAAEDRSDSVVVDQPAARTRPAPGQYPEERNAEGGFKPILHPASKTFR